MSEQDDIRDLAAELNKPPLAFEPSDARKGVIVSVQGGPPPSVTVRMSGSTVQIPGVVYLRSYRPVVGDTVLMIKVGGSVTIIDAYARNYPESQTYQQLDVSSLTATGTVLGATLSATGAVNGASASISGTLVASTVQVSNRIALDASWTNISYLNGWSGSVQLKRLVDGTVIWRGTTNGAGPDGVQIGTIPAGFRPPTALEVIVARPGAYGTSKVAIGTAGEIVYWTLDSTWVFNANGAFTYSLV